jgi:hypothetical protein
VWKDRCTGAWPTDHRPRGCRADATRAIVRACVRVRGARYVRLCSELSQAGYQAAPAPPTQPTQEQLRGVLGAAPPLDAGVCLVGSLAAALSPAAGYVVAASKNVLPAESGWVEQQLLLPVAPLLERKARLRQQLERLEREQLEREIAVKELQLQLERLERERMGQEPERVQVEPEQPVHSARSSASFQAWARGHHSRSVETQPLVTLLEGRLSALAQM